MGIEVWKASPTDIDALAAVRRRTKAVYAPEDPPVPAAELALRLFQVPPSKPQTVWLARLDGAPAGIAVARLPRDRDQDQVMLSVEVGPAHRRRGVATALVATALADLAADRALLTVEADPGPAVDWCRRLGLTARQTIRQRRLHVPAVDPALLDAWTGPAAAVAAGYRVVTWRGDHPPELVPLLCEAAAGMADAPTDDLECTLPEPTPERAAELAAAVAGRLDPFVALAVAPDGHAAGFTELGVHVHRPVLGEQGDTVVVAAHRGHRIGRWLKAVNLRAAATAHPELTWVTTANADSNPWMLAINDAMGFRPHRTLVAHQGPVAGVRAGLTGPARRATVWLRDRD